MAVRSIGRPPGSFGSSNLSSALTSRPGPMGSARAAWAPTIQSGHGGCWQPSYVLPRGQIRPGRPAELKFANVLVVRCSSTPPHSSAAQSITARSTVRPEFQSERSLPSWYARNPGGENNSRRSRRCIVTAPLLSRHVRPRYCAVQRFLRAFSLFLV